MIWLAFVIGIATIIYLYLKNINNYWITKSVKQGKPWLLFGDIWSLILKKESFPDMMERIYNECPGTRYSGFYQFMTPTLILKDPDLIKQLTVKDFDHFVNHRGIGTEEVDPLIGKNLFSLRGKRWRDMRSAVSPSFTSSKMRYMYTFMKETADNFVEYFLNKNENSVQVELSDIFKRYTNDVIATTAFGFNINSLKDKNHEFYLMGKEATDFSSFFKSLKFFVFFTSPKLYELSGITMLGENINNFFTSLIYDALKQRREKNIVRMDVLHLLMEAQKGNLKTEHENADTSISESFANKNELTIDKTNTKTDISDLDIAAQAMVFFFAGLDSVSSLMCFMAYELAVNPEIQAKLRAEITDTYENSNGKVTYETLTKMKYMDMVVNETLRKWPNAVITDRICTKPYTIEPKTPDEKPLHLNVGDILWIPTIGIHRDPKYYPNPEQFDPERFNDENKKSINPYTYIPFGVGPRICIGLRFALLETKTVFFNILRNFEIVPNKKMTIPVQICKNNFTMTAKDGFWFNFERINKL